MIGSEIVVGNAAFGTIVLSIGARVERTNRDDKPQSIGGRYPGFPESRNQTCTSPPSRDTYGDDGRVQCAKMCSMHHAHGRTRASCSTAMVDDNDSLFPTVRVKLLL